MSRVGQPAWVTGTGAGCAVVASSMVHVESCYLCRQSSAKLLQRCIAATAVFALPSGPFPASVSSVMHRCESVTAAFTLPFRVRTLLSFSDASLRRLHPSQHPVLRPARLLCNALLCPATSAAFPSTIMRHQNIWMLTNDDDDNDNDNDHNHETTLAITDSVRSGTEGSDWSASRGTSPVDSDADVVYEVQNSDDDVVLEKPAESAQAEL
ncbi:hypothetical protein BGY98DRAFT_1151927, partial [Russula aff. rugulosa BPL654]